MPNPDQLRILTVILFPLLLLFGIKRPVYAVAAYMVLVYCKLSFYYPFFGQIRAESLFAVLILLRVFSGRNCLENLSFSNSLINKYLFWFVLCVVLSFAFAWDYQYSWDQAVYHFIKTLVLYVMIVCAIETKQDLKIFIWAFILMFAYLAYEPTYYFLTGSGGSQHYYGTNYIAEVGLLSGHVALANNVNQMLPLVWFLFFGASNKWLRALAVISFIIFFVALVGSGSRGGIIGMLVWGSLLIWFAENRAKTAIVALLLGVIVFFSVGSALQYTASRINTESTQGRFSGLIHGLEMVRKGNVVGVGPGCYLIARQNYFSFRMESHNLYGQLAGDLGVPGLIVVFLLFREMFRGIRRIKLQQKALGEEQQFFYYLMLGVQASLITRLVISMASHGLYYFYWYVMAAIIVVSQRLIQEEGSPPPPMRTE